MGRLRVIRMLSRAGYSTMAILRMLLHLDQGKGGDLRQVLDTSRPDEDVYSAADRWLSTLAEQENRARQMVRQLEEMIQSGAPNGINTGRLITFKGMPHNAPHQPRRARARKRGPQGRSVARRPGAVVSAPEYSQETLTSPR
jgi:glutathione S-transferase